MTDPARKLAPAPAPDVQPPPQRRRPVLYADFLAPQPIAPPGGALRILRNLVRFGLIPAVCGLAAAALWSAR